jgi:hypothetical protein
VKRARRVAGSACTTLALFAASATAAADPTPVEIELEYRAPGECPDRQALESRVRARSERVRIGTSAAPERSFDVRVEPSWHARIQVRDRDGQTSTREIEGETCREVVEAAALIVAVLADPEAATEPQLAEPVAAASPAAPPSTRPLPARPEPSAPWPFRFAFGIGLSLETAPAPDPVLAPRPFVALERRARDGLRPSLRASVARGKSGSIPTPAGIAELSWTSARLEGCAGLGGDDGPRADGCALFDLGTLHGRGFQTNSPTDQTVLWLAPGALGRVGYGLDDLFRIELHGGLVFPLRRYRFFFGPDETAHQVPELGLTAGLGIAVLLP